MYCDRYIHKSEWDIFHKYVMRRGNSVRIEIMGGGIWNGGRTHLIGHRPIVDDNFQLVV